jgi:sugar phosphate isomerase/epimerase
MSRDPFSRRSFLALSSMALSASSAFSLAAGKKVPVGLELYSVRGELIKDTIATVRAVAKMGYKVVEFYAPYFSWTPAYAQDIRKLLDDLGIKCNSTHNGPNSFTDDGLKKAIELNQILGSTYVVWASAGRPNGLDGWKSVAATLTKASENLRPAKMRTGYHNHQLEFIPVDGKRPMEVIAANTPADVMLQLDVGTCVEAGSDPVAWINANPGRIRCLHCKDWAPAGGKGPDQGYKVLFGEGVAPWTKTFGAAEATGGVEYYLIEQEGSRFPELETAERCLATWKKMRA